MKSYQRCLLLAIFAGVATVAIAQNEGPYIPGYMDAHGTKCTVYRCDGGLPSFSVLSSSSSSGGWLDQILGPFTFDDFTMSIVPGFSPDAIGYLGSCLQSTSPPPHDFTHAVPEYVNKVNSRKDMLQWRCSSFTIPELDTYSTSTA